MDLLPCPFCGSTDVYANPTVHWVTCKGCEAEGPYNRQSAIKAWNTRPLVGDAPVTPPAERKEEA